jgi:hypothetical protein
VSLLPAQGLFKNVAIIIVATKPHWENIAGRLINKGFDIEELRRAGQLTLLDADETLPKFLINDMPDGRTFKGIAPDTIGKARANGRYANVRWWGEMVNVLYVKGNGQGSTRLEEFFDEVAHQESIAIFCSFLMDKFDSIAKFTLDRFRTSAGLMLTLFLPRTIRGTKNAWIELSWKFLKVWRVNFCIGWGVPSVGQVLKCPPRKRFSSGL